MTWLQIRRSPCLSTNTFSKTTILLNRHFFSANASPETSLGVRLKLVFVEFRVRARVEHSFKGENEGRGKVLVKFYGLNTGKLPWPPHLPLEETSVK